MRLSGCNFPTQTTLCTDICRQNQFPQFPQFPHTYYALYGLENTKIHHFFCIFPNFPTQTTLCTDSKIRKFFIFPLKLRGTARDRNAEYLTHFPKLRGTILHGTAISRIPLENRGQRKLALSAVFALSWRGRKRRSAKSDPLEQVSVQSRARARAFVASL